MDTSLALRPARWILSVLACLLATLALGALPAAQGKGKGKGARPKAPAARTEARGKAPSPPAVPSPAPPAAPRAPQPKITPTRSPAPPRPTASSTAALWKRLDDALRKEYVARHPERAFAHALAASTEIHLGTCGSSASVRWRDALTAALAGLGRLEGERQAPEREAQLRRLSDWLQQELLLLDGLSASTESPSSYVQRATRTLRAASEAAWIPPEERQRVLAELLGELPGYFRDARISLVAFLRDEIELTLRELEDLREQVNALAPLLAASPAPAALGAAKPPPKAARPADPLVAVEGFRAWLVEQGERAGGQKSRLDADEWTRLVRFESGARWTPSELKARGLRELARLEPAPDEGRRERRRVADADGLVLRVASAAALAVHVGRAAHCLRDSLEPQGLEFAVEASPRAGTELVWLRPGAADTARAFVQLPHPSWSPRRVATRSEELRKEGVAALGVRHGLAGAALFGTFARAGREAPLLWLENRLVREGLGLYALDWLARVDWVANPFRADAEMLREFARQRATEAARCIAALELHAEGLSLREAAQAFQRRTGVDEETAWAEVLAAERDPLRGIGYLGWLELLALEQRLAGRDEPRKGPRLVLLLVARHPELRPRDLAWERSLAVANDGAPRRISGAMLEKTGATQQEQSRSR